MYRQKSELEVDMCVEYVFFNFLCFLGKYITFNVE